MPAVPLVSIVTPVYNGEAYLGACIESVLRQTFSEWEYLIVDNRSTDGSAAIAEGYAARDPRIRVVRPDTFVFVHQNHNRAARLIDPRSRYAKFVGADDLLYPECLERMVAVAERYPSASVVSAHRLEGDRVQGEGLVPSGTELMPGRTVIGRALLGPPWVTGSPTTLLFRAELVRRPEPFFDENVWHADTDAAYRCLLGADLGFVHEVLTFTRLHPGALTNFSHRVNSYLSHSGRMLIRYGRKVLSPAVYRTLLRSWLWSYGVYLGKQRLKPSRWREREFSTFHRWEIERMLSELGEEEHREVRAALWCCSHLVGGSPDGVRPGLLTEAASSPGAAAATSGSSEHPAHG